MHIEHDMLLHTFECITTRVRFVDILGLQLVNLRASGVS